MGIKTEIDLYNYQSGAIDKIFERFETCPNDYHLLYQLPTGGGKTIIFSEIVRQYLRIKKKKVVVLTHRIELCNQTSKVLSDFGVLNKVINSKASLDDQEKYSCFVAMVETLNNRLIDDKLDNKRLELSEILTKEFGSQRAQDASRLIKRIDVARSISDKKFILEELEVFLESPEKKRARLGKIEAKKREQEKLRKQVEKKKMDKLAKELERERKREQKRKQKRKYTEAKERTEKKLLGPCADISGGWGKTKCLAIWKSLPVKFVCSNVLIEKNQYVPIEIEIKNHDDIKVTGVLNLLSPKIIENNLLRNGTFKISYGFFGDLIKFKVSGALDIYNTQFEQETMGMFINSGYCANRL